VSLPVVSVLVLNWNGRHHLEAGLPSLLQTSYSAAQFTVLDNASTDGSVEWLGERYPGVAVEVFEHNLGFAGANNRGLVSAARAGAKYAVLLNNDTRVDPDWLDALVQTAEANPSAALCAAQQRAWDGSCEYHFRFIPEWAEADLVKLPVKAAGPAAPTAFASGCALLLRLEPLERMGAFDERYFCYVEDVDLSLRAWLLGYEVLNVPASVVYHRFTGSDSSSRQRMFWG